MDFNLIKEGFFRELPYGEGTGPSIHDAVGVLRGRDLDRIVAYLMAGHPLAVAPGPSRNVLSPQHEIIGSVAILTDGKFEWPKDLAFYVENYGVALSNIFLQHMRNAQWSIGSVEIKIPGI